MSRPKDLNDPSPWNMRIWDCKKHQWLCDGEDDRQLIKQTGFTQGLVSAVLNGKRNHHKGYTFKYEYEVIGNVHENPELLEKQNNQ